MTTLSCTKILFDYIIREIRGGRMMYYRTFFKNVAILGYGESEFHALLCQ